MEVAIIGGGASGIVCAVSLMKKSKNLSVTVYEKLPRVLKKILVTGNGRCNLTNINLDKTCYRGDVDFTETAFFRYPPESNISFFKHIGLLTKVEDAGRVYPMSSQAASVVNVLMAEAQRLGVKMLTDTEIVSVKKEDGRFILNNEFGADFVVICAGGSAQKQQGTDGGSFRLLESLGIAVETPVPALTALNASNFTSSLKGVRNVSFVRLYIDGNDIYDEKGEVQYTDYGISGIPIMQLSGLVATAKTKNITVVIDSMPDTPEADIEEFILKRKSRNAFETAETLMCGMLPKALGNHLLLLAGIKKDTPIGVISENKISLLANIIKFWEVPIDSVRGFDFAQVTAGGAKLCEFSADTLESKKVENLYCTGEALNIYGLCGGYNLQWAWSSGRLCADSIVSKENKIATDK